MDTTFTAPAQSVVRLLSEPVEKPELPPLDPRLLIVVIAARRALLIMADALGEIAGLETRART